MVMMDLLYGIKHIILAVNEFDGIRMTIVGSDGYIYASGFVRGDEARTIFIVYVARQL